jgi:hypothetical protein
LLVTACSRARTATFSGENMNTPDSPKNSQIQMKSELNGMTMFWKKPNGGLFRYFIVLFLCFWLCGWFVGLVSAGKQLLTGEGPNTFLSVWLAMWSLGGIFAGGMIYLLLRPQKPESVTLERNRFTYDTGSAPMNFINPYYMMRKKQNMMNPFSMMFQKRKTYELSRAECPEFVLEGLGDDQRLRFDDGADRITIGESLKEPEREWLAEVLNKWRIG